jgi:hypothetical protein
MPLVVRILLAWSTVSVVVSPFVGKLLASGSQVPATASSAPPALRLVRS